MVHPFTTQKIQKIKSGISTEQKRQYPIMVKLIGSEDKFIGIRQDKDSLTYQPYYWADTINCKIYPDVYSNNRSFKNIKMDEIILEISTEWVKDIAYSIETLDLEELVKLVDSIKPSEQRIQLDIEPLVFNIILHPRVQFIDNRVLSNSDFENSENAEAIKNLSYELIYKFIVPKNTLIKRFRIKSSAIAIYKFEVGSNSYVHSFALLTNKNISLEEKHIVSKPRNTPHILKLLLEESDVKYCDRGSNILSSNRIRTEKYATTIFGEDNLMAIINQVFAFDCNFSSYVPVFINVMQKTNYSIKSPPNIRIMNHHLINQIMIVPVEYTKSGLRIWHRVLIV